MIIAVYHGSSRDEGKRSSKFRCYEGIQERFHLPFNFSKNNANIMINAIDTLSLSGIEEGMIGRKAHRPQVNITVSP